MDHGDPSPPPPPPGGLEPFALELYFARHEFSAQYLMCCSDAESLLMSDLLKMADPECRALWDGLSCG